LINQPEVKLNIKDEAGKATEFTFARSGNGYRLETGNLPEGNYTFSASTKAGDKPYSASGKFTIAPLQLELLNPVANHQLLYQISSETGAELFYHNQLEALEKSISENQNIKPILYDTLKPIQLLT
jgi:hypothetical protein